MSKPTLKTWSLDDVRSIKTTLDTLSKDDKDSVKLMIIEGSIQLKEEVDKKEAEAIG